MIAPPGDPTLDPFLVGLKNDLLARNDVREYLSAMRAGSLGLVLAGGGGKGAYEGGVLLALYDFGLRRYAAIAGTSVGALNAAVAQQLFATNDRDIVARLWGNLSSSKVLSWSVYRTPLGLLIRIGLWLSAQIPMLLARFFTALENKGSARTNEWLTAAQQTKPFQAVVLVAVLMAVVVLLLVLFRGWPPNFDAWSTITFGALVVMSLLLRTRDPVGRYLSLASNVPLQRTIRENIDVTALRRGNVPVYCTISRETEWWDPFEISEWSNVSDSALIHSRAPGYLRFADAESDEEAMEWLLQTAALPEIFPRKPIRGHYAVDGGLNDNVPIYPVAMHQPDKIIVVYLDHRAERRAGSFAAFYTDEAARTWWMAESKAWSDVATRREANTIRQRYVAEHGPITDRKPRLVPPEPRLLTHQQFVPIAPTASLGNLFTGTLNFSAGKARRLLQKGYLDTLLRIELYAKVARKKKRVIGRINVRRRRERRRAKAR